MKITVTTDNATCSLEVADDLEIENFKVLCEVELGVSSSNCTLMLNGRPLPNDKKTLQEADVKDGDLIFLVEQQEQRASLSQRVQRSAAGRAANVDQIDFGSIQIPGVSRPSDGATTSSGQGHGSSVVNSKAEGDEDLGLGDYAAGEDNPEVVRDMLLANPEQRSLLKHHNPSLADALETGSLEEFSVVLKEQQDMRKERDRQRVRLLAADPFDMDAQKLIAEEIKQQNINANMEAAMEHNPESFGIVIMLYINCKVNGHPVKAFIDSGAQTTIMSEECAERCNIMRLVDRRWAGTARGVGTQKIIGRVHMGQIQIERDFLASSFSILADQPMDMLLGLDMLKRHQMVIDLKNNELLIGTTNSRTKFLPESELPQSAFTSGGGKSSSAGSQLPANYDEDEAMARVMDESGKAAASASTASAPTTLETTTTAATTSVFPEADIAEIMQIGFNRQQVLEELNKANGDKTLAIAALFAKSFNMKEEP